MKAQAAEVAKPFEPARVQFEEIVEHLQSSKTVAMTHSELEELLQTEGRELLRQLLQGHLDYRGVGEVVEPVVGSDGIARPHRRPGSRSLVSIFGLVTVRRTQYGARGTSALQPLDAELNLPPERYSHGMRQRVAKEAAKNSFDEVVATVADITGSQVPKRQVEQLAERAAADFDPFYATRAVVSPGEVSQTGPVLVLSVDGKGVVMRQKDLRPATRKAAQGRTRKLKKRLTKGEKRNAKRMATVATVYTIDRFKRTPLDVVGDLNRVRILPAPRPRPQHKRVWASLEKEPRAVIGQAFEEALRRDPQRQKRWVAPVDGNLHQLDILRELAAQHGVQLTIVVDVIHVLEYLWKAALAFHDETSREAEEWVHERLLGILHGRASLVAAAMRRSATRRGLQPADRKPVDKCADYLLKYKAFLRYDDYLAAGLPIASGVIEGTCRHLVKDRMDLTGARWGLHGAESVLRLRALHASGDFEAYWQFHLHAELDRNHCRHYAHTIPATRLAARQPSARPILALAA